ncbi:BlaI/MecI/CopY family transcriptional regulator [Clostridium sp. YIM B02515]|uniref:BlaI/MecI/CopY family transcriptional regulator n=1 Tax=Clostridium rhizosphaerae TaxID=2803861 RepID=A0ABS1TCK4_9CLOT|nr:BlaI/MecI/CopY family transcriptional regulator [Clostridium rhizosphaerae]MBL4937081.1 BlaI/MecI/CopY family transcriptional regulator [Clostridium rhizosphaerae]
MDSLKISDSEWEIMKVIWQNPNCTAGEVIDALKDKKEWQPKTVKTLIRRLVDKKALGYEQYKREYKYYPLVEEGDCVKEESKSFLQRVYRGSLKNMLLNFIEDESLTKEDIEELTRILEERK